VVGFRDNQVDLKTNLERRVSALNGIFITAEDTYNSFLRRPDLKEVTRAASYKEAEKWRRQAFEELSNLRKDYITLGYKPEEVDKIFMAKGLRPDVHLAVRDEKYFPLYDGSGPNAKKEYKRMAEQPLSAQAQGIRNLAIKDPIVAKAVAELAVKGAKEKTIGEHVPAELLIDATLIKELQSSTKERAKYVQGRLNSLGPDMGNVWLKQMLALKAIDNDTIFYLGQGVENP
jgi:hypothetical protein